MPVQPQEFIAVGGPAKAAFDSAYSPKDELAVEVVRSFGKLSLRHTGSSMLPSIWPGDLLCISRCGIAKPDPPVSTAELLGKVVHLLRREIIVRIRSQLKFPGRAVATLVRRSPLAGRLLTRLHHQQYRAVL